MLNIGLFGTEDCRPHITRLHEYIGAHKVTAAFGKFDHAAQVIVMIRKYDMNAVIITDDRLLKTMLNLLPDFICPRDRKGNESNLSMNNYHGSFIKYEAKLTGHTKDVDVLFLNPLNHLVRVPEAPYIYKRYITKITKPDNWMVQPNFTWELIDEHTSDADFGRVLGMVSDGILASVDIETDKDSPLRTINCCGYGVLRRDGSIHQFVIPIRSMRDVIRMRELNATKSPKVMQGGTYDAVYFLRYACPLNNWLWDTSNLFHSWYAELPKRLDYIAAFSCRYIRYWKDDAATGGSYEYFQYNARDCWATLITCCSLLLEMPEWARQNYVQEFPINFPNIHMELDGLATDKEEFDKQLTQTSEDADECLRKLRKWVHPDFNPRSPDQVKRLLFVLGYRDRDGGVSSSDESTLVFAADTHPLTEIIVSEILEYRGLAKLRDTYLVWDKIWGGRLFYRINANGTDSGRLSSGESSFWCGLQIQNIPRGTEVKRWVRADQGWVLGENDFAQSEARCVGYLSGCQALIDLVESPHDYHAWNAASFFGIPYESIYSETLGKTLDKKLRDLSKRVNHGSNYNMTKYMLLITMGPKAVREAKRVLKLKESMSLLDVCDFLLSRYSRTYPEVKNDWYKDIIRQISLTKKLVSPLGWTRYFFGNPSKSKNDHDSAVAHGPQNLSAKILCNGAMMPIFRDMLFGKLRGVFRLKANIHDSLLYGYKENEEWVPQYVANMMRVEVKVRDIKGVERVMVIPPDISAGKTHWSMLK